MKQECWLQRSLQDAIAAKQDDIARLQAKEAMSQKALDLSAAQVTELKGALKNQADSLQASETAKEAVEVGSSNAIMLNIIHATGPCDVARPRVTAVTLSLSMEEEAE